MWVKLGEGKVYTQGGKVYAGVIWIRSEPGLVRVEHEAHSTQVLPLGRVDRISLREEVEA